MLLALLQRHWRLAAVLALMLGSFFVGRISSMNGTDKTTDKTSEQVATDTTQKSTEERQADVVTTVTTRPDGTVVKTVVDHTKTTEQKSKTTDTKVVSKEIKTESKPSDPYRPDWSAGAFAWSGTDFHPYYSGAVGRRVFGTNAWFEVGLNSRKELGVGVRVDL